jgi:hypothetical protein
VILASFKHVFGVRFEILMVKAIRSVGFWDHHVVGYMDTDIWRNLLPSY